MKEKLEKLTENSYAKYSNFKVSAVVVMKDGREYSGVNIENASYGATVCAERVAIFNAVKDGYRKGDFESLHVFAFSEKIASPCFVCRQVITEFFEDDKNIYLYSKNLEKSYKVKELCPYPFNEDNL